MRYVRAAPGLRIWARNRLRWFAAVCSKLQETCSKQLLLQQTTRTRSRLQLWTYPPGGGAGTGSLCFFTMALVPLPRPAGSASPFTAWQRPDRAVADGGHAGGLCEGPAGLSRGAGVHPMKPAGWFDVECRRSRSTVRSPHPGYRAVRSGSHQIPATVPIPVLTIFIIFIRRSSRFHQIEKTHRPHRSRVMIRVCPCYSALDEHEI